MTGSNEAMQVLKVVGSDIDGTSQTSLSFTCPQVTPNSAIYFYQFTDKNSANPSWTTRFTIASASGESTTPTNSEQSDGQTVLWGTGSLASSSSDSSNSTSSSSSSPSSSSSDGSSAAKPTSSNNNYTLTVADNSSTTATSSYPTTSSSLSSSPSGNTSSTSGSTSNHDVQGLLLSAASLTAALILL